MMISMTLLAATMLFILTNNPGWAFMFGIALIVSLGNGGDE